MLFFLIPLILGFAFNLSSAFTMIFSRLWGARWGTIITIILRDILGIPIWATGFVLAARASSPPLFASTVLTEVVGWSMVVTGAVIISSALLTLRWRAAKPSVCDGLAQDGLYAHVRHPIHTGTFLEFAGLFLLRPTQAVGLACVLGCGWLLVQTKLEELDLVQRLPAYQEYMSRVPRFWPRLRIK
jgi:protein-S-isoprenylcysteine O-methyltransferase Ste14